VKNDAVRGRTPDEEKAFYDEMWSRYGHLEAASPAAIHRRRIVSQLAAQFSIPAPRVLDVGCGQGELLRELDQALPGARISGSDLSAQSLEDSRASNPGFELFELDIADAEMSTRHAERTGQFDLVVCCEVLEHIVDDAQAARNLGRLLSPNGVLIATVPGGKMSRFDQVIGHQRHYSTERLRDLLGAAGLQVERVIAWGFPFHNIYRSAVRVASRLSMSDAPGLTNGPSRARPDWVSRGLSAGYVAFSRVLNPLFSLNIDRHGEQMIAVARRAS
jgi:SAM-dependent methyltransferase